MTRSLSLTDRWNRYRYLQSVELWLDAMPGRDRRAVLSELRSNLEVAAAEVGMTAAIADLGRPRALARQYQEQEPSARPRWNQGALAAALLLGAWMYATLFYALGMLDALQSAGATRASGSFLGTRVLAEVSTDGGISAEFSGLPWGPLVVAVLVFLLVSRVWTVRPRRPQAAVAV